MVLIGNHSFFFGTWFHGLLFEFWVVSQKCWQKIWYFGGFMKCKNKINWNHLLPRLGPRGGAEAGAEPLGPSLGSRWFHFFFCISWIPPKLQFFLPTFSWIPPTIKKNNQWNPGHKNKKIWMVYHEIQHWWFWTKFYPLLLSTIFKC